MKIYGFGRKTPDAKRAPNESPKVVTTLRTPIPTNTDDLLSEIRALLDRLGGGHVDIHRGNYRKGYRVVAGRNYDVETLGEVIDILRELVKTKELKDRRRRR